MRFRQAVSEISLNQQSEVEEHFGDSGIWLSDWVSSMNGMNIKRKHRSSWQLNGVKKMDLVMSNRSI